HILEFLVQRCLPRHCLIDMRIAENTAPHLHTGRVFFILIGLVHRHCLACLVQFATAPFMVSTEESPSMDRVSATLAGCRSYRSQSPATRSTSSALLRASRSWSKRMLSSRPVRQCPPNSRHQWLTSS